MKNTRLFLGLVAAVIHSSCGACEDGDIDKIALVVPASELVTFEEGPQHDTARDRLTDLFTECYKNNNAEACQEIIVFIEKKALVDKLILLNELYSKQQELNHKQRIINTQRETIDGFNELNRRRNERINKREEARKKEAREKKLSNKLNEENN